MSCSGCRVLRRGCSEQCILRPCLDWIESPQAQANATLFVSKFFGRSDLMSFISGVPETKRPALFQSLLFEACGRTVNPVSGAVGLLSTGNWHVCQAAVETVLAGGAVGPMPSLAAVPAAKADAHGSNGGESGFPVTPGGSSMEKTASFGSGVSSDVSPEFENNGVKRGVGNKEPKLLNLFG